MVTTAARAWCIPLAIRCFRRQSGLNGIDAELVVVSEDPEVESLVPDDPRVRFVRSRAGLSLGQKHNAAVEACRHPWLAKWDDDDWHAPRRLGLTLRRLRMADAVIAGTRDLIFHELVEPRRTFLYQYRSVRPWVAGNALVFARDLWKESPFPDRDRGVDTVFAWQALSDAKPRPPHVILDDPGIVVLFQHGQTTGQREWKPEPPEFSTWAGDVAAIVGEDLALYESAFRATVP
jgi:hypothetical protein